MDKDLLRIILAVIGVFLLLAVYLCGRLRKPKKKHPVNRHLQTDAEPDAGLFSLNPAEERAATVDTELAISSMDDAIMDDAIMDDAMDDVIHRIDEEEDKKDDEAGVAAHVQDKEERSASTEMPALIQLSVVASRGSVFSGDLLIGALTDLGLEYGEMEIFHRYDKASNTRLFSVASMVKPGTFPIDQMSLFQCPGLLLFFQPLDVPDPMAAFNVMIDTCHELRHRLDGEELDSKRNPLTEGTIEALRRSLLPA